MVFPRSQTSQFLSSLSSARPGRGNGTYQSTPTSVHASPFGNLLPRSPSFSAADTGHRIPHFADVRDLGVPLDTTFTASAHCILAANTARRLLFLVHLRSFSELSKTAFTPNYGALVRPNLEYAMEDNAPTLRVDTNQFEWVQRLATRPVRNLRHVPYEERLRQLSLFLLERRRLRTDHTLACKIFKGKVDLNPSEFFLRPPEPD